MLHGDGHIYNLLCMPPKYIFIKLFAQHMDYRLFCISSYLSRYYLLHYDQELLENGVSESDKK